MIRLDDELAEEYLEESREHLATMETDLFAVENGGTEVDGDWVNRAFDAVHAIQVEGQGSTFWFTSIFELTQAREQHAAGKKPDERFTKRSREAWPTRDARILVAEDNATNLQVAMAQLRKLGYKAESAGNGAEAFKAVQRGGVDLVLMDCEMPVMDGFEATRRIRKSLSAKIPIVALTADAMPEDRDRCLRGGMNDYLSKPVDMRRLADVLAKWLPVPGGSDPAIPTEQIGGVSPKGVFEEETLLDRLMGDRNLASLIIKSFVRDFPTQLANLRARLAAADAPGARFHAHTIKGAAATVSAEGLHAIARVMEQAGTNGQLERCGQLLPGAAEEFERFKNTVQLAGWV